MITIRIALGESKLLDKSLMKKETTNQIIHIDFEKGTFDDTDKLWLGRFLSDETIKGKLKNTGKIEWGNRPLQDKGVFGWGKKTEQNQKTPNVYTIHYKQGEEKTANITLSDSIESYKNRTTRYIRKHKKKNSTTGELLDANPIIGRGRRAVKEDENSRTTVEVVDEIKLTDQDGTLTIDGIGNKNRVLKKVPLTKKDLKRESLLNTIKREAHNSNQIIGEGASAGFRQTASKKPHIKIELKRAPGINLWEYLKLKKASNEFTSEKKLLIIQEIAKEYKLKFQDQDLAHWDIKPRNIMIDDKGDEGVTITFIDLEGNLTLQGSNGPTCRTSFFAPKELQPKSNKLLTPQGPIFSLVKTFSRILFDKDTHTPPGLINAFDQFVDNEQLRKVLGLYMVLMKHDNYIYRPLHISNFFTRIYNLRDFDDIEDPTIKAEINKLLELYTGSLDCKINGQDYRFDAPKAQGDFLLTVVNNLENLNSTDENTVNQALTNIRASFLSLKIKTAKRALTAKKTSLETKYDKEYGKVKTFLTLINNLDTINRKLLPKNDNGDVAIDDFNGAKEQLSSGISQENKNPLEVHKGLISIFWNFILKALQINLKPTESSELVTAQTQFIKPNVSLFAPKPAVEGVHQELESEDNLRILNE